MFTLLWKKIFFSFRFLVTSGQPQDDIAKYSRMEDRLEILERTLEWGHLAPTAPDTLGLLLPEIIFK